MIAFLVVTSIINLSLGYVLACYVGRTQRSATAPATPTVESLPQTKLPEPPVESGTTIAIATSTPTTHEERRIETRDATWSPAINDAGASQASPALATSVGPELQLLRAATVSSDPTTPLAAETVGVAEPEVEEDLLAGIEEFRNQLAKIKGITEDQTAPTANATLAATTS